MTDLSAARLTKLSPAALRFLRAYVHGMALRLTVGDNEGVHPDVLAVLAESTTPRETSSALKELTAAEVIDYDDYSVWIRPDGIRRAVDESLVEMSIAWTLWPHDDVKYEDVINESMGDTNIFDDKAWSAWRDVVIDMIDEATLDHAFEKYDEIYGE